MEIKDYVKQFRDLQKSHKKVRVEDFCRENLLDYYEMVEALKQEKLETESYEEQVQCGDLVMQTDNINPYDYWSDLIDFIGCELLEQRRHMKACFLFSES